MKQRLSIWFFVASVIIAPLTLFAIVRFCQDNIQPLPYLGDSSHRISDFAFFDQDGKKISNSQVNGKVFIANYFFTHCPSVCPRMMNQLKRVQSQTAEDIVILSFSVDPERDSVERLKRYAEMFDIKNNWRLLTGSKKELYRMARKDFLLVATDGDGRDQDFIHSENLVLIDESGKIRGYYKGTDEKEVNKLIRDIERLQTGS